MNKWSITFAAGNKPTEEAEAGRIDHSTYGERSWIIFTDAIGEALRLRSDSVKRVDRVG